MLDFVEEIDNFLGQGDNYSLKFSIFSRAFIVWDIWSEMVFLKGLTGVSIEMLRNFCLGLMESESPT